jgi:hypothetical protein
MKPRLDGRFGEFIPVAAASTILARSTMRASAVALRVKASRRPRSSWLKLITNGLRRDTHPPANRRPRPAPPRKLHACSSAVNHLA